MGFKLFKNGALSGKDTVKGLVEKLWERTRKGGIPGFSMAGKLGGKKNPLGKPVGKVPGGPRVPGKGRDLRTRM